MFGVCAAVEQTERLQARSLLPILCLSKIASRDYQRRRQLPPSSATLPPAPPPLALSISLSMSLSLFVCLSALTYFETDAQ